MRVDYELFTFSSEVSDIYEVSDTLGKNLQMKSIMKNFLFPLVLLLTATSLSLQAQSAADESAMQTFAHNFMTAYNEENLDAIGEMYTEYAVRIDKAGRKMTGRDQIAAFFAEQFRDNNATLSLNQLRLTWSDRERAWVASGTFEYFSNASKFDFEVPEMGAYANVMVKDNDHWKIAKSMLTPITYPFSGNVAAVGGQSWDSTKDRIPVASKSVHLFDLPAGITEAEWSAALTDMNSVIAELGYSDAGYFLYKTENAGAKDYRYYFEGVWPSDEVYAKIHENPAYLAVSEKYGPLYEKIKTVEIYRRVSRVE